MHRRIVGAGIGIATLAVAGLAALPAASTTASERWHAVWDPKPAISVTALEGAIQGDTTRIVGCTPNTDAPDPSHAFYCDVLDPTVMDGAAIRAGKGSWVLTVTCTSQNEGECTWRVKP